MSDERKLLIMVAPLNQLFFVTVATFFILIVMYVGKVATVWWIANSIGADEPRLLNPVNKRNLLITVVSLAAGVAVIVLTLPLWACVVALAPAGFVAAAELERDVRVERERQAASESLLRSSSSRHRERVDREHLVGCLRRLPLGLFIDVRLRERQGPECLMEDGTITVNGQHFEFSRRTVGAPGDTCWLSESRGWTTASSCEAALLEASRDSYGAVRRETT